MINMAQAVFAFIFGAVVGSFLNACIHRLPRNISLTNPNRSFCPSCDRMIPWYENLPLISWLALRGRCAGCGNKIAARYFFVELLTALAFFFAWRAYGAPLAPVYCLFLALLITATFIDIEHFIIPDSITWGGTVVGVILAGFLPEMMSTESHLYSALISFFSAALGFGLLWLVVELGKLAFGKKHHVLEAPEEFLWLRDGESATLKIGEETLQWDEIFSRDKDELLLSCNSANIGGQEVPPDTLLRFRFDRLVVAETEYNLDLLDTVNGMVREVTIPREAMGFGDVKFIAAIGAFLGWQAVIFTLFASSIIGCVAGVAGIFMARDRAGSRIPFGPFLALGAAWWIFGGRSLFNAYLGYFSLY